MSRIKVTVNCENCSRQFDYGFYVADVGTVTASYGNSELQRTVHSSHGVTTDLQKKIATKNALATLTPCPDCGYTQSWMVKSFQKQQRLNGLLIFLAGIGAGIIFLLLLLGINKLFGPFDEFPFWSALNVILVPGTIGLGLVVMIAKLVGLLDFTINPNKKFKDPGKENQPKIDFS